MSPSVTGISVADAFRRALAGAGVVAQVLGTGRAAADYTQALGADALKGARLGIARDFMGQDQDVDWVIEAALAGQFNQVRPEFQFGQH